jgi:hypothetical protein
MTHGMMLRKLKNIIQRGEFVDFPAVFFDDMTGEIFPYEHIKDFCRYWLQKDLKLYTKFREEFSMFRSKNIEIFDALAVLNREENRKKINNLSMIQFRIRTIDFVEATSVILNLADMLTSCCSSIIDEMIPDENLDKALSDKKDNK